MDFARLRYFCTVAKTGSVHRAAEILHLSPAAISKAIKLLEEEAQVTLFVPSGRGIALTEQGKLFSRKAEDILRQVDDLQRLSTTEEKKAGPIRIASFEVFTTHFLGPLIEKYFPTTPFILYELGPGKLEEALAEGHIDLGVTYIPIPRPEIDFLKVSSLKMGVYGSSHFNDQMPLEKLPFVIPVSPIEGSPNRIQGLDGWPDHLAAREIKYRVTLMESALEIARRGLGVVYLPEFIAKLHNEKVLEKFRLRRLPVKLPFPSKLSEQPIYILKRKNSKEDSATKRLAAALRQITK